MLKRKEEESKHQNPLALHVTLQKELKEKKQITAQGSMKRGKKKKKGRKEYSAFHGEKWY